MPMRHRNDSNLVGAVTGALYMDTPIGMVRYFDDTNTITATLPANYLRRTQLCLVIQTVNGNNNGDHKMRCCRTQRRLSITTVHGTQLFNYTGAAQTATVPSGITSTDCRTSGAVVVPVAVVTLPTVQYVVMAVAVAVVPAPSIRRQSLQVRHGLSISARVASVVLVPVALVVR
jgi:hypothetical protein